MKLFYIIIFLELIFVNGQTINNSSNFSMKSDPYVAKVFDKSKQNIYYKFKFVGNSKMPQNLKETICLLQIGNQFSKFSDLKSIQKDSLQNILSQKGDLNTDDINKLLKAREVWSTIVLKDFNVKVITVQDKAKARYQYEINFPEFKWALQDGIKTILGYKCYKASVVYSGRQYVAWYTSDIPIDNGPYVFNGLPGLILELEDVNKQFQFTAVALDKVERNILLRNEESIFKVSKEQFQKVQKSYHDNPGFFHGQAYNSDGSRMDIKSKPIPYNPIELE